MRGVEMARDVLDGIDDRAERLQILGRVNETRGRLDARTVEVLRQSGVMHMLQPEEFGGIETHPGDFAEALLTLARLDGSAAWVAATVGVPPWVLATTGRRLRDEVWEADPGAWVASGYRADAVMLPVADGYRLSGQWRRVAGADHCQWFALGARVIDAEQVIVFVPRSEVQVADDSLAAIGLVGTGSKTVAVDDVLVPVHRVLDYREVADGTAARRAGLRNPIYHIPFGTIDTLGRAAAVVGMADGVLEHLPDGDAAAEVRASRLAVLGAAAVSFDLALDGSIDARAQERVHRDQVAAARRAVNAVDDIICRSGVDMFRRDNPAQRFWRDAHVGLAALLG